MRQVFLAVSVSLAALAAAPAMADIIIVSPSSIQGQNILFNDGVQTGTTVNGFTNSTPSLGLDFTSGGAELRANGGQARIEGALDGSTQPPNDTVNLTQLFFELTDGGTFNELELRLFGGDATTASFTLVDDAGQVFTFANQAITGDGRFGFRGINGQSIASVSFTVNGTGIQDVRQIRLDPVFANTVVPEPAAWALMIGGFGMIGATARRRRVNITYA